MSWFLAWELLCGSPAFPSIQTSPRKEPGEKDGSEPLSGPAQKEAQSAKVGAAVHPQRPPHTPLPMAPQAPTALAITENARSFFSSLQMQTHLYFICLRVFHFLFWKVIRVLHAPFITKEAGKRGGVLGPIGEEWGRLSTQHLCDPVLYPP